MVIRAWRKTMPGPERQERGWEIFSEPLSSGDCVIIAIRKSFSPDHLFPFPMSCFFILRHSLLFEEVFMRGDGISTTPSGRSSEIGEVVK
jgi:hypothetical protein